MPDQGIGRYHYPIMIPAHFLSQFGNGKWRIKPNPICRVTATVSTGTMFPDGTLRRKCPYTFEGQQKLLLMI